MNVYTINNVLKGHSIRKLDKGEPLFLVDFKDALLCDDHVNTSRSCERQVTLGKDFGLSSLGRVFHRDDDFGLLSGADQVHRAAHSLHKLSGNHPVCQISILRDLHCTKNCKVDVAAAERFGQLFSANDF